MTPDIHSATVNLQTNIIEEKSIDNLKTIVESVNNHLKTMKDKLNDNIDIEKSMNKSVEIESSLLITDNIQTKLIDNQFDVQPIINDVNLLSKSTMTTSRQDTTINLPEVNLVQSDTLSKTKINQQSKEILMKRKKSTNILCASCFSSKVIEKKIPIEQKTIINDEQKYDNLSSIMTVTKSTIESSPLPMNNETRTLSNNEDVYKRNYFNFHLFFSLHRMSHLKNHIINYHRMCLYHSKKNNSI